MEEISEQNYCASLIRLLIFLKSTDLKIKKSWKENTNGTWYRSIIALACFMQLFLHFRVNLIAPKMAQYIKHVSRRRVQVSFQPRSHHKTNLLTFSSSPKLLFVSIIQNWNRIQFQIFKMGRSRLSLTLPCALLLSCFYGKPKTV